MGPLPADIPTEGNCPKCGAPLPVGSRWCLKCCKKVKRKPTKKQVIKRCVAWVLVLAILSGSVAALWGRQIIPGVSIGGRKPQAQTLQQGETPKPGVPVSGAEVPEGSLSRGEVQARQTAASALGISEGELGDCRTTRAGENTFYRFEQRHNGLEVYGRSVILVSSEGETAGVFGNYLAVEDVDTTPKLSAEEAAAKLDKAAGEHVVLNAELTVYSLEGHTPELAWKYEVLGENMMGECLVSAGSGKILYENSFVDYGAAQGSGMGADGQGHTFVTEQRTGEAVYRLEDIGRGIYVYDADGAQHDRRHYLQASDGTDIYVVTSDTAYGIYNMNGSEYTGDREKDFTPMGVEMQANGVRIDTAASGSTSWEDPDGVMLMWALQRTNDFYGSVLGMDSYDDKGGAVYAAYGDGSMTDNAYSYNGLISEGEVYLSFGAARALAVDVIGHEYAHSVTRNVVNWGEGAETTAVSEAYSDIFGELAEDFAYDGEMNNSCNWDNGARNMASPGENGQPSIYKGLLWRNNDDGHNNSTVISHAAYNMCREEFIFTEGLTTAQLARIFKQALHKLAVDCGPEQLGQILMEIAETERDKGSLNDSQLLRVHLALARAGLVKLDLKYIPEMDFIRLLAQAMAATVPDYLLDYIGVSREYLEEAYYYQLMEMWVVLNDPEVQEAFREIWEYVISGDPLD